MSLAGHLGRALRVHETSVVKIDDDIPLDKAALVGCGVTTAGARRCTSPRWCRVRPVVVCGRRRPGRERHPGRQNWPAPRTIVAWTGGGQAGVGRAVRPPRTACTAWPGAGIAHRAHPGRAGGRGDPDSGRRAGLAHRRAQRADLQGRARGGTSVSPWTTSTWELPLQEFTLFQKELRATCSAAPTRARTSPSCWTCTAMGCSSWTNWSPRRTSFEDVNQGYQDMLDGKNIHGLILHDI